MRDFRVAAASVLFYLVREAAATTAAPVAATTAAPVAAFPPAQLFECNVVVPDGKWQQGVIREAIHAGKQDVTVPRKLTGFNRTLSIDGLCLDAFSTSSNFQCASQVGELRASLVNPAASQVKLKFGAATCPLTAISIQKSAEAKARYNFDAELRLEFDGCTAATVSSAAVLVGLVNDDAGKDFNLRPWTQEVCKIATTTLPATAVVTAQTKYTDTKVGDGKCDAEVRKEIKGVTKSDDCKMRCVGNANEQRLLGKIGCQGYAFEVSKEGVDEATVADEVTCIFYGGLVSKATGEADWICRKIAFTETSADQSAPAALTPVADISQILAMKEVFGAANAAYMEEIHPPKDKPGCFPPMWWFRLEDRVTGKPMSLPIKNADWADFLATIPEPVATTSVVSGPQVVDRVLVNTCTKNEGWGSTTCSVPVELKTACRSEELNAAIISGVITSALTWIMVAAWFFFYLRFGQSKTGYNQLQAEESGQTGSRVCTHFVFKMGMIGVASGGALLACWVSMQFLDAVMRSSDCYDFAEFLCVIIAVVLSVALSIIIFTLYMARAHPGHPHPILHDTGAKGQRTNTKLMLVEVSDGGDLGQPLDSMTATKEDGVWTGFQSTMGSGSSPFNSVRPASPNASGMHAALR